MKTANFLDNPQNLSPLARQCLGIIDNASKSQIQCAVEYNRYKINKLLIKLLTINLISDESHLFSSNGNNTPNSRNDNQSPINVKYA